MPKPLIILGSHRRAGHTRQLLDALFANQPVPAIDLLEHEIAPYAYSGTYPATDAFLPLIAQLLAHEHLVMATPVYWYAMSGRLKNFFDRLTELVTTRKALGRQLRGKTLHLVAVGADAALPTGFTVPFASTAAYFDMTFGSVLYASSQAATFPAATPEIFHQFREAVGYHPI
ncbi:MAG: flavodoxin family protein [Janthinobacterium lividum]